ncbi:hypothetical protein SCALM49S_01543 [Streptomyces californicus]
MKPGGIRAALAYAASAAEGDGVVAFAEGFTVQPFANTVNVQRLDRRAADRRSSRSR